MHVDDGLLYGGPNDHRFKTVMDPMKVHFNIKVWKTIHEEDRKFFGMWWKTTKGRCLHMDEYINNVWPAGIGKTDDQDRSLGADELAVYRHPCKGEVDSEQGCAGVCLWCKRACPS